MYNKSAQNWSKFWNRIDQQANTHTTPPELTVADGADDAPSFSKDVRTTLYKWLLRKRATVPGKTTLSRKLQSLYGPALKAVSPASMFFLEPRAKVFAYARKVLLKIRYRCVFIQSRITPNNPRCTLCGHFDGHTHLVANCSHPVIHGLICSKHNDGAQMALKAFRNKSTFGSSALIANVGNGEVAPHEKTLPAWLRLTDYNLCPDVLIIKGWTQEDLAAGRHPTPQSPNVSLVFIEYKTCNDYEMDRTVQEKVWDYYTPTPDARPGLTAAICLTYCAPKAGR